MHRDADAIAQLLEDEPIDVPDVVPVFAPDGPVASALGERYRYRSGQVEMAELVRHALVDSCPAFIEAGTGSGKSFAYLIPLILSGARGLISTANKTLQTQLWEKDIPTLRRVLGRDFSAALLKGQKNYVCQLKLGAARQQMLLSGFLDEITDLRERLKSSESGDVEELGVPRELREAVTAGPHECLGYSCPVAAQCYHEQARLRAEEADIVVVNHALFASCLTRTVLSPRPIVIIDEAHELARYVVDALCLELRYESALNLINDNVVMRHVPEDVRKDVVWTNKDFFDFLSGKPANEERRWAVSGRLERGARLASLLNSVRGHLLKAYPAVVDDEAGANEENARYQLTIEWVAQLADEISALAEETPADKVRYCEEITPGAGVESVALCQEPTDVTDFLRETLFGPIERVVCTGATLTVGSRFEFLRQQIGAPRGHTIERIIESPFDFPSQTVLYTPNGLEPQYGAGEDAYVLELAREIWRLVTASRGRAFVLCTSTRRMNELYEILSPHLDYTCYCQNSDLSRAELIDLFKNDAGGAVLFATRSFWEGVDIPGQALSLVVIDKLPFAPQRDPVVQHRHQLIRDHGGNPFQEMTLPEAILAVKQGVGRLIRAETDRGVMAVLDSRINTKRYGQQIVASLPRARRTRRIADVRKFFADLDS